MQKITTKGSTHSLLTGFICTIVLTGCATTATQNQGSKDPWQGWNRGTQSFNDGVDKHVLKPLAKGYKKITTDVIDQGVSNFFSNFNDLGVTINDVLQLKLKQGGMDMSRFLVNSTVGIAGVIDVATKLNLPKHNEDFGQTLGFWGIPAGPYLVLPFFGPSSPREAVGRVGDAFMNPLTYVSMFGGFGGTMASGGARLVDVTDTRAELMTKEKILNEAVVGDRYEFIRNTYQQSRESLIHDASEPLDDDDLFEEDDTTNKTDNNKGAVSPGKSSNKPDKNGLPPVQNNSRHFLELTAPIAK